MEKYNSYSDGGFPCFRTELPAFSRHLYAALLLLTMQCYGAFADAESVYESLQLRNKIMSSICLSGIMAY